MRRPATPLPDLATHMSNTYDENATILEIWPLLENLDLWCYIVITMKRTQITIRRIGNSHGIVIPKPLLAQIGLEGHAEMTIERDALVLRRPAKATRAGWAAAAQKIAEHDDDALAMGEFGNEEDAELSW
jgi:antitoxin MazE